VAEANFSASPDTADRVGHGTHVAGIVAGTGAASGGLRRGVAPGALLMNVKVLDDDGWGSASDVIAGMEWAAAQGADVINVSIGAGPSDGRDPLSQAVNAVTEAYGVLVVASAGNLGFLESAIESPGAADAALTVGNVTKDGELFWDSSRGPRLGDHAVKPEITAPGTDIAAPRAARTALGRLIDPPCTRPSRPPR